jgi:hypothetical protein
MIWSLEQGIGTFAEEGGPVGLSLGLGYFFGTLFNEYVPGVSETAQSFFQPFTDSYYGVPALPSVIFPPCDQ